MNGRSQNQRKPGFQIGRNMRKQRQNGLKRQLLRRRRRKRPGTLTQDGTNDRLQKQNEPTLLKQRAPKEQEKVTLKPKPRRRRLRRRKNY